MKPLSNKKKSKGLNRFTTYAGRRFTLNLITSLLILPACGHAVAANNYYVDSTTAVTSWDVGDGTLYVLPGGQTRNIRIANGSVLDMNGATTSIGNTSAATQAITLQAKSSATITGSTIINSQTGRSSIAFGSNSGSQATIINSTLTANGRGFTISGVGSTLNLFNTTVTGLDNGRTGQFDGGQGGSIFDGTLTATDSSLTGDRNGLRVVLDDDDSVPVAILNNTTVTGKNGSAVVLGTVSSSYGSGVIELQINNGSVLNGGNNTIIEAIGNNTANIVIDNSQLTGNITAEAPTTVNAVLRNQASLQGDMQEINTLTVDNSQVTGDINLKQAGDARVQLTNNASVHGNVNNIDYFSASSSQLTGNLTADSARPGTVSLLNGSEVTGDLQNITHLTLDNSVVRGSIASADPLTTQIYLRNHAFIEGDLSQIASLSLDASQIDGKIVGLTDKTTTLSLSGGSSIRGDLSQISALNADASQIIGNIEGDTQITLSNHSLFQGSLNQIGSLNVDASQIHGNINNGADVTLSNGSLVEGDLNQIAALTLNDSQIKGDIAGKENGAVEVSLLSGSTIQGDLSAIHTLSLTDSQLTGNVLSDGTDGTSVTLKGQTSLTGDLRNYDSLSVSDGAVWNLTQSATTGDVTLGNGGQINLHSTEGNYRTLTASRLSGEGLFTLHTNIAEQTGDRLIINGEANGRYSLAVVNSGAEPQHDNPLTLVETGGGNGVFSLENGVVDAGVFEYKLEKQGNDWALEKTDEITPSVETILSMFNATPSVWNGELNTVRGRLGDLRITADRDGGVWAQYLGQQTNVSPRAGTSYQQKQYGLTIGADKSHERGNGNLLTGLFTGYSDNQISARYGEGNIDSVYVGAYATWIADSGWFFDTMLKGNQFHNEANARMSDGQRARSHYDSYGIGLSAELGKNIRLQNNWFIEPSLQLTSLWVSGNDYRLDNGMKAQNDNTRSRQAALNLATGKDITLSNGMMLAPYAKVAYRYEFAKDNKVRVNDVAFNNDMSGGTAVYGAGLNAQVSDKSWVYAGIDYAKGPKSESPWAGNVGIRINW